MSNIILNQYTRLIALIVALVLVLSPTTAARNHSERTDPQDWFGQPDPRGATEPGPLPAHLSARTLRTEWPGNPARCPYDFTTLMPPGIYCGYIGAAVDENGEVCESDMIAIWSSYAPESGALPGASVTNFPTLSPLYISLAADRPVVLRSAGRPERDWARITGYTLGEDPTWIPLFAGKAELTRYESDGDEVEVLTISLNGLELPRIAGCALASYEGTFVQVFEFDFTSSPAQGEPVAKPHGGRGGLSGFGQ